MFSVIDNNRDKLLHFLMGFFLVTIALNVMSWILSLIGLAFIGFAWEFAREEMYGIPICWLDQSANLIGGIAAIILNLL